MPEKPATSPKLVETRSFEPKSSGRPLVKRLIVLRPIKTRCCCLSAVMSVPERVSFSCRDTQKETKREKLVIVFVPAELLLSEQASTIRAWLAAAHRIESIVYL